MSHVLKHDSDPIERKVLVFHTDVKVSEVNDAFIQILDFLPPSRSPFPLSDVMRKIKDYIRQVVLSGCDISISILIFQIQVKVTPGHCIEIFVRRILPVTKTDQVIPIEQAVFTEVYTGEWR